MDRLAVITKLRKHEPELKAAGITRMALFGSVARGDASVDSDIDLMAEFDGAREFSLLDRVRLENRLADLLGMPVDLAPPTPSRTAFGSAPLARLCLPFKDFDGACAT